MATVARTEVKPVSTYKDYVNFLGTYKGAKREDDFDHSDSGLSKSGSTSWSSISSDAPDFSKTLAAPYNNHSESSNTKKFAPVKLIQKSELVIPHPQKTVQNGTNSINEVTELKMQKSEITIEIKPNRSVAEVSKIFEKSRPLKNPKTAVRSQSIASKIDVFEKNSGETKKRLTPRAPPPKIIIPVVPPSEKVVPSDETDRGFTSPPPPESPIPVPPPAPPQQAQQPQKMHATVVEGPQTKYTVHHEVKSEETDVQQAQKIQASNGVKHDEVDRNDPRVKKAVYGALRGMYGAYHDKANNMVSTLPKHMVSRNGAVQDIIDKIASSGDLDKLNGRVNPKVETE